MSPSRAASPGREPAVAEWAGLLPIDKPIGSQA